MECFKVLGQPLSVYSDDEDEGALNSEKLQVKIKGEGIEHIITKTHANQAERMIRTTKKIIADRLRANKDKTWVDMLKPSLNRYNTQVHSDVCQEKSTLQSKLELSRCARIIILSLTQGHTTTNQLCWFCDTMWNQTIDYFKHAHSDACSQWIQTASSNKQSPVRAKICQCDHGAESSITKKPQQVAEKAETHTHVDGMVKP